jgi:hypothetical protein
MRSWQTWGKEYDRGSAGEALGFRVAWCFDRWRCFAGSLRGFAVIGLAKIVPERTLAIRSAATCPDGTGQLTVDLGCAATCLACFEAYRDLPNIVIYDGRRYGLSCYDSDRAMAIYLTSDWVLARYALVA